MAHTAYCAPFGTTVQPMRTRSCRMQSALFQLLHHGSNPRGQSPPAPLSKPDPPLLAHATSACPRPSGGPRPQSAQLRGAPPPARPASTGRSGRPRASRGISAGGCSSKHGSGGRARSARAGSRSRGDADAPRRSGRPPECAAAASERHSRSVDFSDPQAGACPGRYLARYPARCQLDGSVSASWRPG